MELKIERIITNKNLKVIIPVLISLFLVFIVTTGIIIISALSSNKIYNGVYINNISVSGLSIDEAKAVVGAEVSKSVSSFRLSVDCNNKNWAIDNKDLGFSVDIDNTVNNAYQVGRQGNIFKKLGDIMSASSSNIKLHPSMTYNTSKVDNLVNDIYNSTYIPLKQPAYNVANDKITICSGSHSETIDKDAAAKNINAAIKTLVSSNLAIPIIITKAEPLNVDKAFEKVNTPPVDAYVKANNKEYTVVDHVVGHTVDKQKLKEIVDKLNTAENLEMQVPFVATAPSRTTDYVKSNIFRDTISTFTTSFSQSASSKNRNFNISHACDVMNGLVIEPGQTFSFNTSVNNKATNEGFLNAPSYVSGKVVDSLGGGICQVSTTLYNSVLLADLEVVSRRNHTFTVGYVPFGQDATVSEGSTDFKFKNNTTWPIKIVSIVSGGTLTVQIIGTNEDPGKVVKIVSEQYNKVPFTESITYDATKYEGYSAVTTNGLPGWTADTYKIIYRNNVEISKTKISTSKYIPLSKSITKGSKKQVVTDPGPSTTVPPSTPAPTPVPPAATAPPINPGDIVD